MLLPSPGLLLQDCAGSFLRNLPLVTGTFQRRLGSCPNAWCSSQVPGTHQPKRKACCPTRQSLINKTYANNKKGLFATETTALDPATLQVATNQFAAARNPVPRNSNYPDPSGNTQTSKPHCRAASMSLANGSKPQPLTAFTSLLLPSLKLTPQICKLCSNAPKKLFSLSSGTAMRSDCR